MHPLRHLTGPVVCCLLLLWQYVLRNIYIRVVIISLDVKFDHID